MEGLRRLHWFRLNRFCDNILRYAFSLIELSIVLIIIGLLVAGVTGGKSLIESAKMHAYMNELRGYKQAVNTFYAAMGRLPGDLNNDGIIGDTIYGDTKPAVETYTTSSFPAPYNSKAPNAVSAPFIDMYLEGVIDFKPTETNPTYPYSKVYKREKFYFITSLYCTTSNGCKSDNTTFANKGDTKIYLNSLSSESDPFSAELAKKIDVKYDDGVHNTGQIRANCDGDFITWGSRTYDAAITRTDDVSKRNCNTRALYVF